MTWTIFGNIFLDYVVASKKEILIRKCCNSSQNFRVKFYYAEYVYMIFPNLFMLFISPLHLWILILCVPDTDFGIMRAHFWIPLSPLFSLFKVGEFYEAIGIDACILVEYAGLNPFGGLRSDSIPRAGCPVVVHGFPCVFFCSYLGMQRCYLQTWVAIPFYCLWKWIQY